MGLQVLRQQLEERGRGHRHPRETCGERHKLPPERWSGLSRTDTRARCRYPETGRGKEQITPIGLPYARVAVLFIFFIKKRNLFRHAASNGTER